VTHDPTVARHSNRVVIMRDGRALREEIVAEPLDARAAQADTDRPGAKVQQFARPPAA
jgi:hypothetical protein